MYVLTCKVQTTGCSVGIYVSSIGNLRVVSHVQG